MRSNIVLDDALLQQAMELSGARTKPKAVQIALEELVARHRSRQLGRLRGKPLIAPEYDVRAVRRAMGGSPG
ncbi:MAG: type II toxin-antitoxin system VapB family antitoxin [Rubrivivax sp.]